MQSVTADARMMTFNQLCELEPELKRLHHLAGMIRDDENGKYFCANDVWYSLFKPKLYNLVGWGREHSKQQRKRERERFEIENPELSKCFIQGPEMPKPEGIEILDTCEAYDCAYHTIYDQLPNCRNCGCM